MKLKTLVAIAFILRLAAITCEPNPVMAEKLKVNQKRRIEMIQNSNGYKVLRFWHNNGEKFFDYECNSKRITG